MKKSNNLKFISLVTIILNLTSLIYCVNSGSVLGDNRITFSTKNHSKSNGINMEIEYPSTWKAYEGKRPHVVQSFYSKGGEGTEGVLILIQPLPYPADTVLSDAELNQFFDPKSIGSMMSEGDELINVKKTKIEGLPAVILEYYSYSERAGIDLNVQIITYMFIYKLSLITIQCSVGGLPCSRGELAKRMISFKPTFSLIANSILLPDRWNER